MNSIFQSKPTQLFILVMLVVTLPLLIFVTQQTQEQRQRAATEIIASDAFHRANQTYWGTASDGQRWGGEANSYSSFSIYNNTGVIAPSSDQLFDAILGSTATNMDVTMIG